jgi:dTDP-4-dehydrorhamnose reductase
MTLNRVLITGGTGLLGKALIDAKDREGDIHATYLGDYNMLERADVKYRKMDIRDTEGFAALFQDFRPEVVVHTASIGSPDFAEKNKALTYEINVRGTAQIAALCLKHNAKMIYISSNGIYDGEEAPYAEDHTPRPINYYGETKLDGEKEAFKADPQAAVVRPILMYGWPNKNERGNIVTLAIEKLSKGEKMAVYEDVFSNALYSVHCAEVIWRIIREGKYETFNIGGGERTSIYGLIVAAAKVFGLDEKLVVPVRQGYFNELVPRPRDTSYDTTKMEKVLGIEPLNLKAGLERMKEDR